MGDLDRSLAEAAAVTCLLRPVPHAISPLQQCVERSLKRGLPAFKWPDFEHAQLAGRAHSRPLDPDIASQPSST